MIRDGVAAVANGEKPKGVLKKISPWSISTSASNSIRRMQFQRR